jgi:hypothetical protein
MKYLLHRHGSNAANQPMTPSMPVAIVEAPDEHAARATSWHGDKPSVHSAPTPAATILAQVDDLTVYANQHLSAEPLDEADDDDVNEVYAADALRNA